jgi:D-inositol-3-phosphate glycosyltransferase
VAGGPAASELASDPDARRIAELAQRAGVADRVHLLGRLDRRQVAALLRSSDLAVTAPWYEPFGMVPLEAMACGVPVVATSVGGLVDSVIDGLTGLHVPPRQPGELAAAIRRLLDDAALRRRMGQLGAARAKERYGWPGIAAATERLYRHLVGHARPVAEVMA